MDRQWDGKTRGGSFGYLFFIWLVKTFGVRAAYAFLCFVVLYFILFAPAQTASTWSYSRRILKNGRFRSVAFLFSSYYVFGQCIIDKVVSGMGMADRYGYGFDGLEVMQERMKADKGCIIIGAHVGSWQMGAPFFAGSGKKLNVVMLDKEYECVKKVIEDNTGAPGFSVIPLDENDFSFLISIASAFRSGEAVCFQGDRYMEGKRVFTASFMGQEADFPEGPFVMAAKLESPVVFYFAMREKGMKYRFIFRAPDMTPVLDGSEKDPALYIFRSYLSVLEEVVRKYPAQWFNYYDFWKLNSKK